MLNPQALQLRVGVDVGSQCHSVAVGGSRPLHQELTFRSSPIRLRFDRRLVLEPLNKGHHGGPKRVRPLTRRVTARTAHLT